MDRKIQDVPGETLFAFRRAEPVNVASFLSGQTLHVFVYSVWPRSCWRLLIRHEVLLWLLYYAEFLSCTPICGVVHKKRLKNPLFRASTLQPRSFARYLTLTGVVAITLHSSRVFVWTCTVSPPQTFEIAGDCCSPNKFCCCNHCHYPQRVLTAIIENS